MDQTRKWGTAVKNRVVWAIAPYVTQWEGSAPTSVNREKVREVLSCAVPGDSDFVRPTNHSYTYSYSNGMFGRHKRSYPPPYSFLGVTYSGVWIGADSYPDATWDPSLETGLYNAALSDLSDGLRGGIDLSIDLAQVSQTDDLIRSAAHFVTYVRDLKRKLGKNALKAIGGKWLEYQYGWMPTLQTIYDTSRRLMDPDYYRLVYEGKSKTTRTWQAESASSNPKIPIVKRYYCSQRCLISVTLRPPDSMADRKSVV